MNSLSEIKSNEFEQVLYAMETIYSSAKVGKYSIQSEKVALNPDITNIMAHSVDPNEQKYYWIEWRKSTGKHVKPLFERYVSLMELAAKINGFHDASEMWTRQYESDDFIDMLSVYWEGVKPLYLQLHAYVRHTLHDLYGDVVGAKDDGKIPAHLTGDIWCKNWKNLYPKVKPYDIDNYTTQLFKKKMTPEKITKQVENLFVSMGFTKLPDEFWDSSVFTKAKNKRILCEPSAWDMGNGMDFRIKMCATNKIEDLFTIHNLVTLTEYYKEYKGQPYAFRSPANPGFSEAIGETMVLSAYTKDHLKLFGIRSKRSERADINKLMKIALEKVAFLPYSYILILWRHKVFTGEINATNYNSEWWKLRSEYQGIYPPTKRSEDDFDVGSKQHIVANQPYIKYFLSTILQFQFYEALCRLSNFQGPLHKCDITSSTIVGKTLRKAMSMGSSQHWKDVMEVLTGTRKIDSRPLMRYFEPLMKWLQQQNKERNVHIGWEG
ncbi:angiotensin-converting enzyme isoform X1 [Halyomorpha halys]|uniref:angiotensin-converting enzyme isoform X1 n=2 Tax=Halyomorpha halys TaxID=286706 RepID=UPI0034D184D9